MDLVCMIILSVCYFGIGFCTGHMFQLKRNLAKLSKLEDGLYRVKRLSAEADACAEACIISLERENNELRAQQAAYRKKETSNEQSI